MRRADFLKLTGLSVDNHKNMVRHDKLPVAETAEPAERSQGWSTYYPEQAFMTLLAIELAKVGADQRGASSTVARGFSLLRDAFGSDLEDQKREIWFGGASAYGQENIAGVGGPIDSLQVLFGPVADAPSLSIPLAEIAHEVPEIALVNVSRLLRQFRNTAVENEIAIEFDWLVR